MNQQKGLRWLLAAGTFAAVSCATPKTHYYMLEFPHAPRAAGSAVSRQIAVQPFRTDLVYADDRILYREGQNQFNYYEYHRWSSPPGDLVTNYFIHRLRDGGAYTGVSAYKDFPQADFILSGRIHHFEEVDQGKDVSVSVDLEIALANGKTRAPVWRSEAQCSKPLATRDVNGVTQGIHACLEETAAKLLGDMQKQMETAGGQ